MRVFMAILCSLLAVCSVSARDSRQKGTDGQAAIYRLPPFEWAVRCTKYFEGWHSEKHHPYVGYGHRLQPGERYSARTEVTEAAGGRASAKRPAEVLRDVPAVREGFASACHARLQCRSVPSFWGSGEDTPKSTLIRKLEAGDRNIYREYIAFCNYKGNATPCCSNEEG